MPKRTEKYTIVSNTLACMSNQQIQQALACGKQMHSGIGGTSVQIEIENTPVFVKKVPLTKLELKPENFMSTANIFNLPSCYQYGIGSAGFSAWRELAAHIMTSNWVITGKCPNFPMLYNWRIIPESITHTDLSYWGSSENYLEYWENNKSIKERITNLKEANTSVVLFLEHFPSNLSQHLKEVISTSSSDLEAINYIKGLNKSFETVFQFMEEHSFLHMDAHFHNILADEHNIYLSDFGLVLIKNFDLSTPELNFINEHKNYDRCSYSLNLLHSVLTSYGDTESWDNLLSDYLTNKLTINLPYEIKELLSKSTAISEKMHKFYREIQKDKSTNYPSNELRLLLR